MADIKKNTTKKKTSTNKKKQEKIKSEIDTKLNHIIEGIIDKKGKDIVYIDLKKINSSICDYFVICHGTSSTHVGAIAESVEGQVKKNMNIKPANREGIANAEWILLDYLDIVVHIFQEDIRNFYQLELLWADAEVNIVDS